MTRRVNKFVIKVGRHKNNEDQYQNEDHRELDLVEHERSLLSDRFGARLPPIIPEVTKII